MEISTTDGLPLYHLKIESPNSSVTEFYLDEGQCLSIKRVAFEFNSIPYTKYVYFEDDKPVGYVFGNTNFEGYVFDPIRMVFSFEGRLVQPTFNDLTCHPKISRIEVCSVDTDRVVVWEDEEVLHSLNFWCKPLTIIQSKVAA